MSEAAELHRPRRGNRLTREGLAGLANWLEEVAGRSSDISQKDIQTLESGEHRPGHEKLEVILRGLMLTETEVQAILSDPEFVTSTNASGLGNTYLLPPEGRRLLAIGEFGSQVDRCLPIGKYGTTWRRVEHGGDGGFERDEISIQVSNLNIATTKNERLKAPEQFLRTAKEAARLNAIRKASFFDGWDDHETLCLNAYSSTEKDDAGERHVLGMQLYRSMYRLNYVAKSDQASAFRWEALHEADERMKPIYNYLASGIGVCVNLLCDNGKTMVYGQRSNKETFRKEELDVAVVEGMRAKSDLRRDNTICVHDVCYRALNEELGLNKIHEGRGAEDFVTHLCVFEFGVDLTFYQWNFLAFAITPLSLEQIKDSWLLAKSRKENVRIEGIPFDHETVERFLMHNRIWSCGIAAALGTFEFLPRLDHVGASRAS